MLLEGKVVIVTGAGRGLGRAIALRCGQEGAHLVLAGRTVAELEQVATELREFGARAVVVAADVRDVESTEAMAARAVAEFGGVDVLVANSGIAGPTAPLWEVDPADWEETFAVNVRGVFLACRAVLPDMVQRGSGSIVVVGSMSGKRPLANRTPYASSKMALVGLTRTLAAETGPFGVRVNLVSPGPVNGPLLENVLREQARLSGRTVEDVRVDFSRDSPLRRLVEPEQVAATVVFLASDEAAAITGDDLNVNTGIAMY